MFEKMFLRVIMQPYKFWSSAWEPITNSASPRSGDNFSTEKCHLFCPLQKGLFKLQIHCDP